MAVSSISSLAMWDSARASISRIQNQLVSTGDEVTTGRHYDVGVTLGTDTSRSISARVGIEDIDTTTAMNGVLGERLTTMQSSFTAMREMADALFTEATQAGQSDADRELFVSNARSMLATLTSLLTTTSNGSYALSGTNSLNAPVSDYMAEPVSAARSTVIATFTGEFGVAPDDPAVAGITPDQLTTYWSGAFSTLFEDPDWQSVFSSASGSGVDVRIAPNEHVSYSASANDAGVRKLYAALVAVVDSGTADLNSDAFGALAGLVASTAGEASVALTRSQAAVGAVQSRVTGANERMAISRGILENVIGDLESVDQTEASTRLKNLTTQLQLSYAVTSQMFSLSLLDYL